MAVLTADQFAQQMIAQARLLDPSISGEIGTPERKIIDTVAQALADNQVDLTGLASALDVDAKFGANLDRFTALFGFARQQAGSATGFVIFSRNTPAPVPITIPNGTVLQSNTPSVQGQTLQFITTASGTISINATASSAVPIQCVVTGTAGNVAANTITQMVGAPVPGVTAVTNPNALTNGTVSEDDNSYKTRFKNTWARNLAGTHDQYLALAIAGPFTTKANVIGVQSRYQEYTQVPRFDDAGFLESQFYQEADTYGKAFQWTTALSDIPYAKQIYATSGTFVSNGQAGPADFFYRPGIDYIFNAQPSLTTLQGVSGDTLRNLLTTTSLGGQSFAATHLIVDSTIGFPVAGWLLVLGAVIQYSGKTATSFSHCTVVRGPTGQSIPANTTVYGIPLNIVTQSPAQPNFTFVNVYNPPGATPLPSLQALAPEDVVLTEFSYVSKSSRNNIQFNLTNAVDVYVDGANNTQASCVFLPYLAETQFGTSPGSPFYYENFRRDGQPTKRPVAGNAFTPLFQSPLTQLPASIVINGQNFYQGWHYWLVHETSPLFGSIRGRDGIEWSSDLGGDTGQGPPTDPTQPYTPQGLTIYQTADVVGTTVEVDNYLYDANIPTLQANFENARQISTDVLAHKAYMRYFKLDIAVIYSPNANFAAVNAAIATSVQAYMDRQYFGSVIQLSDLLEIIHEVSGVDNVRWGNDLPVVPNQMRVIEVDINGYPLQGASIDRPVSGSDSRFEEQTLYIVGNPLGTTNANLPNATPDSFTLTWNDPAIPFNHSLTTAPIHFFHLADESPITATEIQTAIQSITNQYDITSGVYNNITVTQDTRPTSGVTQPIISFTIKYGGDLGTPVLPIIMNSITASDYAWSSDFFLMDDQLPSLPQGAIAGDTLPGLIIRPRTQNTWLRPGLTLPTASGGIFGGSGVFGVGSGPFGGSGQTPSGGKIFGSADGTFGADSDAFAT